MLVLEVQKSYLHVITLNNNDCCWSSYCVSPVLSLCLKNKTKQTKKKPATKQQTQHFIIPLPTAHTYPSFSLCFHIVRVPFTFPAMSYCTNNFFLQTTCADLIKKTFVSSVAVYLGNSLSLFY